MKLVQVLDKKIWSVTCQCKKKDIIGILLSKNPIKKVALKIKPKKFNLFSIIQS